jgi:hypothetical protein
MSKPSFDALYQGMASAVPQDPARQWALAPGLHLNPEMI